ncbi:DUF5684 domain-containing protein [Leucobacter allii]|uniref:DUF5684 domain-containing protein n=1 Tax=Leucobacter allii TaxID=2932247 RepID=UPI001FD2B27D|nr:DUF5684 domain-containing protein [Leucobacter allii]UOR02211.1 DUF5684 domain-containing protein [Leucobacter allii]
MTENTLGPALFAMVGIWSLVGLAFYLWYLWALSRLFPRIGLPSGWGWIPVWNQWQLVQRAGLPGWVVVLGFVPLLGIVVFVVSVMAIHRLNSEYGKGAGFTVLGALLPPVWAMLLSNAIDDQNAAYHGREPKFAGTDAPAPGYARSSGNAQTGQQPIVGGAAAPGYPAAYPPAAAPGQAVPPQAAPPQPARPSYAPQTGWGAQQAQAGMAGAPAAPIPAAPPAAHPAGPQAPAGPAGPQAPQYAQPQPPVAPQAPGFPPQQAPGAPVSAQAPAPLGQPAAQPAVQPENDWGFSRTTEGAYARLAAEGAPQRQDAPLGAVPPQQPFSWPEPQPAPAAPAAQAEPLVLPSAEAGAPAPAQAVAPDHSVAPEPSVAAEPFGAPESSVAAGHSGVPEASSIAESAVAAEAMPDAFAPDAAPQAVPGAAHAPAAPADPAPRDAAGSMPAEPAPGSGTPEPSAAPAPHAEPTAAPAADAVTGAAAPAGAGAFTAMSAGAVVSEASAPAIPEPSIFDTGAQRAAAPAPNAAPQSDPDAAPASHPTGAMQSADAQGHAARPSGIPVGGDDSDRTVVVQRRVRWGVELPDGEVLELRGDDVIVGRKPATEEGTVALQIPDPTRTVSKSHARLRRTGEVWTIEDLHSTNGVSTIDGGDPEPIEPGREVPATEQLVIGTLRVSLRRID